MSKKNSDTVVSRKPRRVYPYKGANLVCFGGERYESPEGSKISADHPVTKVEAPEEGGDTIKVTQRRKGRKGITETWTLFAG
ncbi:MAG: hypothetical protein GTO63_15400 [Anaerolineae bacterium]|nr:hypothetical protein [Anaerolineae bacterium]NIN96212.1 hypothetical protein [Anaerolineae bacterium]NIQ79234.1 hypothetical protein [Anaerolineae bacterium]